MTGGVVSGGGGGGPVVGVRLGVRDGVLVGLAVVALGDGDAESDGDGLGEGETESIGDGDGLVSGTGMAPIRPSPQARSPPKTGNRVSSNETAPAATVMSRPAAANRAAPVLATCPPPEATRSRNGWKAREVPAVSASSRPSSRSSAPDTSIGRPAEDSAPTPTRDPPQRMVYPPPRKVSRASARSPTATRSVRPT